VVTPPPVDRSLVTITGRVQYLRRSGANDLDVTFRTDDFTIVSATSTTPVHSGSLIGQTDFARRSDGHYQGDATANSCATKITIIGF
jgi:hypothetical protein